MINFKIGITSSNPHGCIVGSEILQQSVGSKAPTVADMILHNIYMIRTAHGVLELGKMNFVCEAQRVPRVFRHTDSHTPVQSLFASFRISFSNDDLRSSKLFEEYTYKKQRRIS